MSEIAGLPFWEMHFDENGNAKHFMDDVGTGVTDLFVFAHGWNNDFNDAKDLYTRYFEVMADVLIAHGGKPGDRSRSGRRVLAFDIVAGR